MARSLPIEISRFQNSDEIMGDLATSARLDNLNDAAQAYAGCAPVIVKALVERCSTSEGATRMLNSAHALTWAERHNPAEIFKNDDPLVGEDVADQIFDEALPSVVTAVATSSGMKETSAGSLIEIASAVTLACLAGEPDRELDFESFMGSVNRAGQAFGVDTSLSTTAVQHADEIKAKTSAIKVEAESAAAAATAASAGAAGAIARGSNAEEEEPKKKKGLLLPLVGAGALCAAGAIGYLALSGGSSDATPDEVAFEATTTTAEVTTTLEVVTTVQEVVEETTTTAAAVAEGDILTLSVPMDNKSGVSESTGTLTFDFNTESGEVCYAIEAVEIEGPFRSHIHFGPEGEDGGIVVDLDPRVDGDTGCVDNALIDTNAILNDLDGHYAELHDVSEEWTIRGQLSEAPESDAVIAAVAARAAEADSGDEVAADDAETTTTVAGEADDAPTTTAAESTETTTADEPEEEPSTGEGSESAVDDLVFDLDSDGANILLKDGDIILQGEVPDQATADALVDSLSGVPATTDVINNLQVVDGAPAPSGRVVIADAIFFDDNSDIVKDIDADTLDAITALAQTRTDWIVTIVGHTDSLGSASNNLELSLRRATAVRDLLLAEGVPETNLRIRGSGETDPVGDNNTDEGRAQNRRIEFEFTPAG